MNKSCQTDFVAFTDVTTPLIITAVKVNDPSEDKDDDEDINCDCCCICLWYLTLGGVVLVLLYYTGAL